MAAFNVRAKEGDPALSYCSSSIPFTDVSVGNVFCPHIKRMKELGITTGYPDGSFHPTDLVIREHMAAFLARAFLGMQ